MRKHRGIVVLVGVAALLSATLAGVAHGAGPASAPRQAGATGTLRIPADMTAQPIELDLMKVQIVGIQIHNMIYGTLLRMTPSGDVVPDLAKSVTVVDPSTIKVELKPNLKFTDGTPVDANAYKFSIERMVTQARPGGKEAEVNQIDTVTVDTPTQFTIRLKTPIAGAITRLMRLCEVGCPTSPTAVQNGADFSTAPVGAGPFKVKSVTPGQEVLLEKNPDYWDAKNIKVKNIQYKNVPASAIQTALQGGQIDYTILTSTQIGELQNAPGVKTTTISTDNSMLLGMMCKNRAPFDNLQIRQALNYALDRQDLNDKLYHGKGQEMWGWNAKGETGYDKSLDGYYDYNLKKAKQLLADAGQPNLTFDIIFTPGTVTETIAQIVQQQYAKAGMTVGLKAQTQTTDFFPNATLAPVNFFELQRAGIPKVSRTLVPGSFGDVCTWDDPQLNALVTQANGLADGSPEQGKVWKQISKRTLETAADVFGLFGLQYYGTNSTTVKTIQVNEGRTGIPEYYIWGTQLKNA